MNKFKKFSPTKIVFGEHKLKTLHNYLPKNSEKILVVTGHNSSKNNNSLATIKSLLKTTGKKCFIYNKIEQNPSAYTINEGASFARKQNIDTVIGLGGGSAMDAAKCIALLTKNKDSIEDYFKGKKPQNLPAFIIEVPTTAGSGSEVNQNAVVSTATKKGFSNPYMFPKVAILDPIFTNSMPYEITVNTGIDALTHAIEGYLSVKATADTDKLAVETIQIIKETLPELAQNLLTPQSHLTKNTKQNDKTYAELRSKMLYASMLGGLVISQTGTIILHALGYSLTVFYGIPHGKANGILLPSILNFLKGTRKANKILQLFDKPELTEFLHNIGISTNMCDYGISNSDIPKFVNDAWGRRNLEHTGKKVTKKDIFLIYEQALKNRRIYVRSLKMVNNKTKKS